MSSSSRNDGVIAMAVAAVGVIAAAVYFLFLKPERLEAPEIQEVEVEEVLAPVPPPEPITLPSPEPLVEVTPEPLATPQPIASTLPRLNESDAPFRADVAEIEPQVPALLTDSELVRKGVRAVHGLSEGFVVKEFRPVVSPEGRFGVEDTGQRNANDERLYRISDDNYVRYTPHVDALVAMPPEQVVALYRSYFPLLQQAYEELGLPEPDFHSVMLRAVDNAIAATPPDSRVLLHQPSVMYEFNDEALESASSVDKLFIRMGPENAERVQRWLEALRFELKALSP